MATQKKKKKGSKAKTAGKVAAGVGGAYVGLAVGANAIIYHSQPDNLKALYRHQMSQEAKRVPGVKPYLNNADRRAHKWNQKHAGPIQMKTKKHGIAKREVASPVSSRRALFHGSNKPHGILKSTHTAIAEAGHTFATYNRQIAENYALGGRGVESKKTRNKGFVHSISRSENHKFSHGRDMFHRNPTLTEMAKSHEVLINRRKKTGHSMHPEHSVLTNAHEVHTHGGYWVHRTPNGRMNRYRNEPRNHSNVARHDARNLGIAVGAGAALYGGYRLHKHFHNRKQADRLSGTHNPYYNRHLKSGKTIRVRKHA